MKKVLSLLLVLAMVLSLAACGAPAEAPEETAAPTAEATEAPAAETEAPTEEIAETEPVIRSPMKLELPEQEIAPAEEVEVPADAPRITMADDYLVPNAMKSGGTPVDPYRPWYDIGSSRQMEGDIFTLLIFLNDYESSWTLSEAESFIQNKYFPAESWLCQQAAGWGTSISFTSGYYGSDSSINVPVSYNGYVGDFNGNLQSDIMEQVAASIGFASKEALHQRMIEYSGKSNIAYVVVVDKPGRSYATMDWYNDGYDYMEYCVLFNQPSYVGNLVYDCPPSTVAHEMLHLFGAEDFYAEGDQRNGRAYLASIYYPYGIMYQSYYDISYNYVDQFTAYAVGWIDNTPSVCYDDSWWN